MRREADISPGLSSQRIHLLLPRYHGASPAQVDSKYSQTIQKVTAKLSRSTALTFCASGRTCHWKSLISFRSCLWLHLNYLKFLSKTSFVLNSPSPRFPLQLFKVHESERNGGKNIVQQQKHHWIKHKIPREGSLQQSEPFYLIKM